MTEQEALDRYKRNAISVMRGIADMYGFVVLTPEDEMETLVTLADRHGYGLLRIEPGLTWASDD